MGSFWDERLCRSCFFCHSWAPEPRERRGLATKKNRGVPGRSGMMKLWFFRHPKPTTKSINKNKQNNRISTSIPAFHLSFSDFHGDLHRFHGFHTLEIGFWHFRRPIPADLDWWYSTPLEYGFQGRTREKSSCEFPW